MKKRKEACLSIRCSKELKEAIKSSAKMRKITISDTILPILMSEFKLQILLQPIPGVLKELAEIEAKERRKGKTQNLRKFE
jgi:hypothetical protein